MEAYLGDHYGHDGAAVLARAAADRLPKEHVFQLMGLTSLEYLTILLPLALFFSMAILAAPAVSAGRTPAPQPEHP